MTKHAQIMWNRDENNVEVPNHLICVYVFLFFFTLWARDPSPGPKNAARVQPGVGPLPFWSPGPGPGPKYVTALLT